MSVTDIFHIPMKQILFCGRKMTEKRARNRHKKIIIKVSVYSMSATDKYPHSMERIEAAK